MAQQGYSSILVERVRRKLEIMATGNDTQMQAKLTRIGAILEARIKSGVLNQKLIDTGRLLNSIGYIVKQNSVTVGSFGVPYASIHEFGYSGAMKVRAHDRKITQVVGRKIDLQTISIGAHNRNVNIKARPYFRPAISALVPLIKRILASEA
jgi:hypothetical protein